jgi:hypothetical protein
MKAVFFQEDSAVLRSYRQVGDTLYERILFKTHFIKPGEDMVETVSRYTGGYLQPGDVIFVSDKALANSQKRAIHIQDIRPGFFARLLYRFVYSSAAGRGIGTPEKMQVAIEQVGLLRLLLAAFLSFITKIFGIRGVFYKIVGEKVRGIDGMSGGPKGPYWEYVILPSAEPSRVAERISQRTGFPAIIADINDLDGHIMGYSEDKLKEWDFEEILRDNPMGQENSQTPIGILRVAQATAARM